MGLFDAFKKKDCEICGKEVGMFGYKKLEDGEICKDCVKLLSPWFDDRRHSTVEQIKKQLAYREENLQKLTSFRPAKTFGERSKIYVEYENGIPSRFAVTRYDDLMEENADLISFKDVVSFHTDIREDRDEIKRQNAQGEMVSYNPPRYNYQYDFKVQLQVRNPYFDDISIQLNSSTIELESESDFRRSTGGIGQFLTGRQFDPSYNPMYREFSMMCQELEEIFQAGIQGMAVCSTAQASTPVATAVEPAAPVATQAIDSWKCTACGSENSSKFCAGCGAPKPVPVAVNGWKCFCGTRNAGRFCENCGTEKFDLNDIECSECSWTAEPEDKDVPAFCPNCGKRFNSDDLC